MLTDGFEYGVGDDSEGFAAANQLAIAQLSALEADAFDMARARDGFRHRPQFHDHPTAACQILFPRGRTHLRAAASIRPRDPARAEPPCLPRGLDGGVAAADPYQLTAHRHPRLVRRLPYFPHQTDGTAHTAP